MKDQFCLRSIPDDLWEWIENQAHDHRQNINSVIISMLESRRRGEGSVLTPFPDRPVIGPSTSGTLPFTFIDLFAGIGGFRLGLQKIGGRCVFTSEWDRFSSKTYEAWFGDRPVGDINEVDSKSIPAHDVLAAGFPCQPFWPAPVLSTRGYESVINCSPFSGESEASPATRGSRTCGPSNAANSAGVRYPSELCGRSRL